MFIPKCLQLYRDLVAKNIRRGRFRVHKQEMKQISEDTAVNIRAGQTPTCRLICNEGGRQEIFLKEIIQALVSFSVRPATLLDGQEAK